MLDRRRFGTPTDKLEKVDLLGRSEIKSRLFKGIGLNTYPVIDSNNLDTINLSN